MVIVVTHLGRERVVALDFAKSFVDSRMRICRSFFQGNALLIHILLGPSICRSNRQSPDEARFHDGNFDHSVSSRVLSEGCRFEKSADVCPHVRNGSRQPQWCGAWWFKQDSVHKSFFNSTEDVSATTSPCGTTGHLQQNQLPKKS